MVDAVRSRPRRVASSFNGEFTLALHQNSHSLGNVLSMMWLDDTGWIEASIGRPAGVLNGKISVVVAVEGVCSQFVLKVTALVNSQ